MSSAEAKNEISGGIIVAPFGIEADHPRNSDLLLQAAPGVRLRSMIDGTKPVIDQKTGDPRIPLDQSRHLATFPKTPGMQIHVNPAKCIYKVIDPLHGNEAICHRIASFLRENTGLSPSTRIDGVPPREGKLDIHRMKTLCRELVQLVEAGHAKVVHGELPTMAEIVDLPGAFLLNPGARVANTQPVYEKDWDSWVANLSHHGG